MYCRICGKKLKEDNVYCSNCGTRVVFIEETDDNTIKDDTNIVLNEEIKNVDNVKNKNVTITKSKKYLKYFVIIAIFSLIFVICIKISSKKNNEESLVVNKNKFDKEQSNENNEIPSNNETYSELDLNQIIEDSKIQSQLPKEIKDLEINTLYLTNEEFPEILVTYNYKKPIDFIRYGDLLVFHKNDSSNSWDVIYSEESYTLVNYVGSLNLNDNKLQQPVIYITGGDLESYQDAYVLIYNSGKANFDISGVNPEVGGSITVNSAAKEIVWKSETMKEVLKWNGNTFVSEKSLIEDESKEANADLVIRYSIIDDDDVKLEYPDKTTFNIKLNDIVYFEKENVGSEFDKFFVPECFEMINNSQYYLKATKMGSFELKFRSFLGDWLKYYFVIN